MARSGHSWLGTRLAPTFPLTCLAPPTSRSHPPRIRIRCSKEGERAPGVPAPLPGRRLRTAEQEAIWGGMGAVRRRQPPEDPFPPPPPSQLRQPA